MFSNIFFFISNSLFFRNTSQEDVRKLCSTIQDEFYNKDKTSECMALLRQLFFILQATDSEHRYVYCPWILQAKLLSQL